MSYKLVIVFKLQPGKADMEVERCRSEYSFVNLLSQQPGFIAYEIVKLSEDSTVVLQTWQSKGHLMRAMPKASAARAGLEPQEEIVLSRDTFAGEVVLLSKVAVN